ncbi:extracellular solute-binding protein [Georgenia sp. MJ173]|uniref:ABC transporter substrate-binding protein n=1 Tax=Georgenia sunbinii TaxID=3117728 RepID=UPI002F26414F
MSTASRLRMVAAAGLAGALLVACGGDGGSNEGSGNGGGNGDGPVPLEMWVFAELHGALYEEMADRWNDENPDRQIDLQISVYPYQDMHNNLQLAVNAGSGMPDIADIEVSKFGNFVMGSNPPLLPLNDPAAPYIDDIVQARLDLYSRDGNIYGYPTHVGGMVAFYNTELLDGAGVDYTTIETWEDFEEAGVAYNEATGAAFGPAPTEVTFVQSLVLSQLGGNLFDDNGEVAVDNPEVVEALSLLAGMQESGALSTIPGGSPDTEEAFGAINNGDFAAIVYPGWYTSRFVDYMPDLEGKIAIAPAPVIEGSDVLTIGGGGTGTSVLADSPNAELAAEWLAFTKLSPEANVAVWEVLGFDPVSMAVWDDQEVTHAEDNRFNQYFTTNLFDVLNEVRDGIGHFEGFTHPDFPAVDSMFTTVVLPQIFDSGTPVEDALGQAQRDLENQLG